MPAKHHSPFNSFCLEVWVLSSARHPRFAYVGRAIKLPEVHVTLSHCSIHQVLFFGLKLLSLTLHFNFHIIFLKNQMILMKICISHVLCNNRCIHTCSTNCLSLVQHRPEFFSYRIQHWLRYFVPLLTGHFSIEAHNKSSIICPVHRAPFYAHHVLFHVSRVISLDIFYPLFHTYHLKLKFFPCSVMGSAIPFHCVKVG